LQVFLVVAVTNIVSYAVTRVLTEQVLKSLTTMRSIASVSANTRRGAAVIQLAELGAAGRYDFPEGLAFVRERLRTSVAVAMADNNDLYLSAVASGGDLLDAYLQPKWLVHDVVSSSYVDRDHSNETHRVLSLSNIMLEYAARAHALWWYSASQYVPGDR
jgi:hypothetical protein